MFKIQSVRVPKERINLYKKNILVGPFDIALIKLKTKVTFIENIITPVKDHSSNKIALNMDMDPILDLSQ